MVSVWSWLRERLHGSVGKPKEKILVVAQSTEQASYWANQLGLKRGEYIYVTSTTIRGYRNPTVFVVGTPWVRSDYDEIMLALEPCDATIIFAEEMVNQAA